MNIISVVVQHPVIMVLTDSMCDDAVFEGIIYDNYQYWSESFNNDLDALKRKWPIRNKSVPYYLTMAS